VSWVAGSTSSGVANGIGRAADLSDPHGLAWDGAHKLLYVADNDSGLVRKIDFTDAAMPNVTRLAGTPYPSMAQDGPFISASFGAIGNMVLVNDVLWVADNSTHLIRRLDLGSAMVTSPVGKKGFPLTKPGPLPAFIHSPWGLALTPRGLVMTSWEENCVLLATGLQ